MEFSNSAMNLVFNSHVVYFVELNYIGLQSFMWLGMIKKFENYKKKLLTADMISLFPSSLGKCESYRPPLHEHDLSHAINFLYMRYIA